MPLTAVRIIAGTALLALALLALALAAPPADGKGPLPEPDAVALEALFFGENARSAFAVGQARGVVMLAAGQRGIACHDYTPQQVKGAVCGSGRAPKDQVQRMVQAVLGLAELPRPDHAADALAVAICHANHAPLRAAVAAG